MSPQTILFRVLDESPTSGPGRGSPFLQHFQETCVPAWHMYACDNDHPILIPFILIPFSIPFHSHSILISIADQLFHSQALNVSPVTQTIAPMWGSDPCFSSPTQQEQVQSF
ncbi:unnamed protein product [Rangifer tarandus platyrhynchus]|uniref:Uncharacterized protein n=1 Tax=Rangifer tarandus platyrhynchus TaxID=3082113 RepID=A0AC60A6R4_RANTA